MAFFAIKVIYHQSTGRKNLQFKSNPEKGENPRT
jgi:hypothetical protein